jgi:ATP-dependent DNA helicase RecG
MAEAAAARSPRSPGAFTYAQRLQRAGLVRDWDLALHLPLRYLDETQVLPISALVAGELAQVSGQVVPAEGRSRRGQFEAHLSDGSGSLRLRWVHAYPGLAAQLAPGRRLRVMGTLRNGPRGPEMVHPQLRSAEEGGAAPPGALTPVYPAPEGLPQAWLRRRIGQALERLDMRELLEPAERERLGLPGLREALRALHHPAPGLTPQEREQGLAGARRRIRMEELLAQQLALRHARARRRALPAHPLAGPGPLTAALRSRLPFQLTADQESAWEQIAGDLAGAQAMNRLLQGDVGSGKTVVAALAAARAIESGTQAALMAPTEILAGQHHERIASLLGPLGVRVLALSGRAGAAERRAALAQIADGSAQLVIGTHALIQEPVAFARLGLAIVDEQHRFGVQQRLALRRGDVLPHLLMLSATPIPRSLAMTYLADLDVSLIQSLPPGRSPVVTKLIGGGRRGEVLERLRQEVAQGRQAYWVLPLVEDNEEIEAMAAVRMVEETRALLPELRLGLLHGQLPGADKRAVMQDFAAGALDVLVATTVVEVGVDVPNASLMVIEHAQRFGLATLHQLRGRVGRGSARSTCVLLYDEPLSAGARERLRVLYETLDGFEVARCDLRLRGPGEFLGARQWGLPMLRFADLERDAAELPVIRALADELLAQAPQRAGALVERWFGAATGLLAA